MSNPDPFSSTTTRNLLQHIVSPKLVSDGSTGVVARTDLINVDDLRMSGKVILPTTTSSFTVCNSSAIPTNRGDSAIAIGNGAGTTSQSLQAIAIGSLSGYLSQGAGAVALGSSAGTTSQTDNAVAIGSSAGQTSQGANAIAIGSSAGNANQSAGAIAIGNNASSVSQGVNSIAIGNGSGGTGNQGANSISIGYYNSFGTAVIPASNIVINATGAITNIGVNGGPANCCYINPIRNVTGGAVPSGFRPMYWNPTTSEIIVVSP